MIHERDGIDAALRIQAIQLEDEYFGDLTLITVFGYGRADTDGQDA